MQSYLRELDHVIPIKLCFQNTDIFVVSTFHKYNGRQRLQLLGLSLVVSVQVWKASICNLKIKGFGKTLDQVMLNSPCVSLLQSHTFIYYYHISLTYSLSNSLFFVLSFISLTMNLSNDVSGDRVSDHVSDLRLLSILSLNLLRVSSAKMIIVVQTGLREMREDKQSSRNQLSIAQPQPFIFYTAFTPFNCKQNLKKKSTTAIKC